MAGDEKENKDPWHKDNIDKTIDKRKDDRTNLLNVINAMDSQLKFEVAKILEEHTKEGPPDWSLLDKKSKNYNKDVAELVHKKIDDVYSVESKLHPLAGVIKKADLEKNYFNAQLVQGLYFGHIHDLKKSIGSKDYMAEMEQHHGENLKKIGNKTLEDMVVDVDPDKHGEGVVNYVVDKYKVDKDKINPELIKRNAQNVMLGHITKQLSKDSIHRNYEAGKKK